MAESCPGPKAPWGCVTRAGPKVSVSARAPVKKAPAAEEELCRRRRRPAGRVDVKVAGVGAGCGKRGASRQDGRVAEELLDAEV